MRIYISGVFDLFHHGHMKLLKKCRETWKNNELLIGIHSDESCESFKRLPIMNMKCRIQSIKEFGIYDEIIENAPIKETKEFYEKYNIDKVVHAHTLEEHEYYLKKCYQVAEDIGIFERIDYTSGISTSEIIQIILERFHKTIK